MQPKVSLLLTAYNFERYIEAAVRSLLEQDFDEPFEVIVVDDCSPDRTAEVVAAIKDPRLRLVRNEVNLGATESANRAFQYARGRYIARLDGDDRWLPHFLRETVQALDENPDVGLVYGDIHTIDEHDRVDENSSIQRPDLPLKGIEFKALLERYYICAPTILARREAWNDGLPFPERFKSGLGDWFVTLKIARKWPFLYLPKPLALYRVHSGGMHHHFIRDGSGERNMQAILQYFLYETDGQELSSAEKSRLFARHYRLFGNGYMALQMDSDARRCYWKALRKHPAYAFDTGFLFPFFGSLIGQQAYNALKSLIKNGKRTARPLAQQ